VKLATYNLNGIRARLPRLLEWLAREQPDVVCLQELKCADESLPIADIEAAGYGAVWHGQKGFNGVAVLAKGDSPKLRCVGLPGDPDDTHSRYIEAEVQGLVVGSIYLPNGNPVGTEKFAYKLNWMERLFAQAEELLRDERPAVLCGDWNVVPEDREQGRPVRGDRHGGSVEHDLCGRAGSGHPDPLLEGSSEFNASRGQRRIRGARGSCGST